MSYRKPVIALVIFLLLLGVYLYDSRTKELERLEKAKEERLFAAEVSEINSFELVNKKGNLKASKVDGKWIIEEPIQTDADQDAIITLLSNVSGAKKRNVFEADDISQYGLREPRSQITLNSAIDEGRRTIVVGESSAYSGQVFAMVEGEDKVFTISDFVANNMDKGLYDLRDKRIASISISDIKSFSLETERGKMSFEKEDEKWKVRDGREYLADRVAVENLMREINNSRAVDFVDTATLDTAMGEYGLEEPKVVVRFGGKEAEPTGLFVGDYNGENGYYTRREERAPVFVIPEELYDELNKDVAQFRDRNFFHTNMLEVGRVEIKAGESRVALAKNEAGKWEFEGEPSTRVDQSEVNLTLSNILNRKADEWVSDGPVELAKYGLDSPRIRFVVEDKDARTSEGILIGDKPSAKDIIYVQRIGEETVWGMDWVETRDFFKTRESFVDKTLVPVDAALVERIEMKEGGEVIEFAKQAGQWFFKRSASANPIGIENFVVDSMLSALTSIKYDRQVELSASTREQIKISEPSLEFVLYDEQGDALGELNLTGVIRENVYAQIGTSEIYRIKSEDFFALESAVGVVKEKVMEIQF